jgi:hypothetical protein
LFQIFNTNKLKKIFFGQKRFFYLFIVNNKTQHSFLFEMSTKTFAPKLPDASLYQKESVTKCVTKNSIPKITTMEKKTKTIPVVFSTSKVRILNLYSNPELAVTVHFSINDDEFVMEENTISAYITPRYKVNDRCEIIVRDVDGKALVKGYFKSKPANHYTVIIQGSTKRNIAWVVMNDLIQASQNDNEAFVRFVNLSDNKFYENASIVIHDTEIFAMNDKSITPKHDYFSLETGNHSILAKTKNGTIISETDTNTDFIAGVYSIFLYKKYIRNRTNVCDPKTTAEYDFIVTLDSALCTKERIIYETSIVDRLEGKTPTIYTPDSVQEIMNTPACPLKMSPMIIPPPAAAVSGAPKTAVATLIIKDEPEKDAALIYTKTTTNSNQGNVLSNQIINTGVPRTEPMIATFVKTPSKNVTFSPVVNEVRF